MGGCGSDGGKSAEQGERGRDPAAQQRQEREASGTAAKGEGEAAAEGSESKALKAIPRSDRVAYVQLGVAASELRTGAAMLSVRSLARRADSLALRQLRPRMEALRPRDTELARLRGRVLVAIEQARRSRRAGFESARRYAPRTLAAAESIYRALKRYTSSHPPIRTLLPD
jgi:hypothetical protein